MHPVGGLEGKHRGGHVVIAGVCRNEEETTVAGRKLSEAPEQWLSNEVSVPTTFVKDLSWDSQLHQVASASSNSSLTGLTESMGTCPHVHS